MTRPTCQTCPAFHPGPKGSASGTCRSSPPTLGTHLKLVREDGQGQETDRTTLRPSIGWFARYPILDASEPCCARHPMYAAYAITFQDDRPATAEDDDAGNF